MSLIFLHLYDHPCSSVWLETKGSLLVVVLVDWVSIESARLIEHL